MCRFSIYLVTLCAAWSLEVVAQPVRTFVATYGSDLNPCSRTSPCRNFQTAMSLVADGGEVVALDSGGYGPVIINKSVALIAVSSAHAAIAPTTGNAILVDASTADSVWIRNLYLNSQGAVYGIRSHPIGALHIDNVVANGFLESGLNMTGPGEIYVSDSTFRGNGASIGGIVISSPNPMVRGTISRTYVEYVGDILVGENLRMNIVDTHVVEGGFWVAGNNAQLDLDRCSAVFGTVGLHASETAVMRVSNSTITMNSQGILAEGTSQILSRQNNTVTGNSMSETFTGTFGPD